MDKQKVNFAPPPPLTDAARFAARAANVNKTYGSGDAAVAALKDVSVDFDAGKFSAIMGPSGSGKSTLMHALAGLDSIDSGQIFIGGVSREPIEISALTDSALTRVRRERIGFIFQSFNLVPTLDARANITLPLSLAGKKPDREWFDFLVRTLELETRLRHKPFELSGGQQQRVAVARALLSKPDVVFADEPTGNLDSAVGAQVLSLLQRSAAEFGQSIIMVTHDPLAAAYAQRVVLLADGRVHGDLEDPTAEAVQDMLNRPSVRYPDPGDAGGFAPTGSGSISPATSATGGR